MIIIQICFCFTDQRRLLRRPNRERRERDFGRTQKGQAAPKGTPKWPVRLRTLWSPDLSQHTSRGSGLQGPSGLVKSDLLKSEFGHFCVAEYKTYMQIDKRTNTRNEI
jgi:hypothetical protein